MAIIKINDQDYDTEGFSDRAKAQLDMLRVTDNEIRRLRSQLAIAQTAREAYASAIANEVVPKAGGNA